MHEEALQASVRPLGSRDMYDCAVNVLPHLKQTNPDPNPRVCINWLTPSFLKPGEIHKVASSHPTEKLDDGFSAGRRGCNDFLNKC